MNKPPHIMIIEAPFYRDIAEEMAKGAIAALDKAGATYARFEVPGALEIPSAILYGLKSKQFDGYVALGCVIKGDTYHFEIVANESARGIMALQTQHDICVGNGILTCYTDEQALQRANIDMDNKGGGAAEACLKMIALKKRLGIFTERA